MMGTLVPLGGLLALASLLLAGRAGMLLASPVNRRARRLLTAAGAAGRTPRATELVRALAGQLPQPSPVRRRAQQQLLLKAGLDPRRAGDGVRLVSWAAPVAGAMAGAVAAPLFGWGTAMGALGGILAGAAAPRLWLANRWKRRSDALSAQLPDALDLLVIAVGSGMSADAALGRIARELDGTAPEMARELGLLALELGFLPDRREAFANLERRAPVDGVAALVALLEQTERFGTPLGAALRSLSADQAHRRMLRLEETAARMPALLTVPMITFILPPLFLVLLGPVLLTLLGG